MKKIVIFSCFSFLAVFVFAAFPVQIQDLLSDADPEKFKLDVWGFLIGILTLLLLPYSLLLLFIRKKNFRGSLAWGWLAGFLLIILLFIAINLIPSGGLLLY